MGAIKVLLDTGALIGYRNRNDQHHRWAVQAWAELVDPLITCEAVLSETVFLLQSEQMSIAPVIQILQAGIVKLDFSMERHRAEVLELLRKYADQPMSLADACLVRMAELSKNSRVLTTDTDFRFYRKKGNQSIPLLAPFQS